MNISDVVLDTMTERRQRGERLTALAAEIRVPWQRLDKALRHRTVPTAPPTLKVPRRVRKMKLDGSRRAGPLTERYRPTKLSELVGQREVVAYLKRFAAGPHPAVLLFEGETGTGKTTAALVLARALGCDLEQEEFGGVCQIASGEQTADAVRETYRQMHLGTLYGSGWKVVIVNEVDRMSPQAETIWLDRLEQLPRQAVVIFTTNYPDKLSRRFRDRCTRLRFESEAGKLGLDAYALLCAIWRRERRDEPDMSIVARVVADATEAGQLSFRRAVQALGIALSRA